VLKAPLDTFNVDSIQFVKSGRSANLLQKRARRKKFGGGRMMKATLK